MEFTLKRKRVDALDEVNRWLTGVESQRQEAIGRTPGAGGN
jgi:hypothetical protein